MSRPVSVFPAVYCADISRKQQLFFVGPDILMLGISGYEDIKTEMTLP
jgi:hypothetical protein